jgi:hypothetical protein
MGVGRKPAHIPVVQHHELGFKAEQITAPDTSKGQNEGNFEAKGASRK